MIKRRIAIQDQWVISAPTLLEEKKKISNATAADGGVRLMFAFKVKINEKMHAEIVEQLEAKLAAGEIPDEEAKTVETVEAINEKAKILTE